MSNVPYIAWRIPCPGIRSWMFLPSRQTSFRSFVFGFRTLLSGRSHVDRRAFSSRNLLAISTLNPIVRRPPAVPPLFRSFKTCGSRRSQSETSVDHGVRVRDRPFSAAEIRKIFGSPELSAKAGNRALAIIQGRRVAGTLDLSLPPDVANSLSPDQFEAALEWLRKSHPLDEDAAIFQRIEREEREEEAKLVRRAQELGLYKPQSGSYDPERSEEGDISGKSVLKEMRKYNEARRKAKEEQERQEWLEGEAADQEKLKRYVEKGTALQHLQDTAITEARPRADPRERPFLAWVQKHHLRATDLDSDPSSLNTPRRLLPSLGFAILVIGGSYIFAKTYEAPAREDRIWPSIPPAGATVIGLIGLNFMIFVLWRVPPAWRMLNRYFISSAMYPRALSMVGSAFSHQKFTHLAVNMAILFFLGPKVHEEVGRGNLLSVYIASGVFGSLTSLAANVLAGRLQVTGLGASGAISGIAAVWCMIHANDQLTFAFLPRELQENISARGWHLLFSFMAFEVISLISQRRILPIDHWAHLGGYIAGIGSWFAMKQEIESRKRPWSRLTRFLNDECR